MHASEHRQARGDDALVREASVRKTDRFRDKLDAIRRQLAARERAELRLSAAFDPLRPSDNNGDAARCELAVAASSSLSADTYEPIRLPSLPNARRPPRASEPLSEGSLSMDALRARALSQAAYDEANERLLRAEERAAQTMQEADALAEEARIAMVLFSQNEKSWSFDERSKRYQQALQARKTADATRLQADDDRILVECLRNQLVDPYASLRTLSTGNQSKGGNAVVLEPIQVTPQHNVRVWILASPLLTPPFTPRTVTPGVVLSAEKELSTHVIYYAAASTQAPDDLLASSHYDDDMPPTADWQCCSNHGAPPAPTLTLIKSSAESWLVSGAGAVHVNGSYLFSGVHNGTRKFKSTAGVELFRKELPKTSSIIRGLLEILMESRTNSEAKSVRSHDQLPTNLQVLEFHESNFKAMNKVGGWMSAHVLQHERQRFRGTESLSHSGVVAGDIIHVQQDRIHQRSICDVVHSRKEASADLCREWVLFMHCLRRVGQTPPRENQKHIGIGCLKRHYFISSSEKDEMTAWAQEEEAWLEKSVISSIIKREAHLGRLALLCKECMSSFQQDLREDTEIGVDRILKELNLIRFQTVRVLEEIDSWRIHARKKGFVRYEGGADKSATDSTTGWSACITVDSGRKLYGGSHSFESKYKRFCRPEDRHGRRELRVVYLGSFPTRDAAEVAYDNYANAEARRLNTTVNYLPRRRSVIRSCGKHLAVESERLGPDYCIECVSKELTNGGMNTDGSGRSMGEWNPPFCFESGRNYILKLANDLDFLDQVAPVKRRLNKTIESDKLEPFPLLGNVFLLPKTPIDDPSLAFVALLRASSKSIPYRLIGSEGNTNLLEENAMEDTLDMDRILKAQRIFLREIQIYHPELFRHRPEVEELNQLEARHLDVLIPSDSHAQRVVQALYWDRCAALRIQQQRSALPYRQDGVWCRPDAGEWAGLRVRGKHQQHVLFENRLLKAGKEMGKRRKSVLQVIRKLLKTPLYLIPSAEFIVAVISEGELVRGDVVMLEVKSAYRFLERYELWRVKVLVLQRWYRGYLGRLRNRATRRALHLATLTRQCFLDHVSTISRTVYTQHIAPRGLQVAISKLRQSAYTQTVRIDEELVVISIHSTNTMSGDSLLRETTTDLRNRQSTTIACESCRRVARSTVIYDAHQKAFVVINFVCCCKLLGPIQYPIESWFVRAYNPLSCVSYRLLIGKPILVQLIRHHGFTSASGELGLHPQPLAHCRALSESLATATVYSDYVSKLGSINLRNAENWRLLSGEAVERRKRAEVDLERARQKVMTLMRSYDVAVLDARKALDFTSRPFDKAQAWDPLENANDWRLLVHKRHTGKDLQLAIEDADRCRFELFQASASERNCRAQASQVRSRYESVWRRLILQQQILVSRWAMEMETYHSTSVRAMREICTTQLALRDTCYTPTRRILNIAPNVWRRADNSMSLLLLIDLPGLHRGRNILRRRVIQQRDRFTNKIQGPRQRLVVDVSSWTSNWKSEVGKGRNIWVSAYDPVTGKKQCIYLEWELVQLLATMQVVRSSETSERTRWSRIADKILSLCMLDRFTGKFTLQRLHFYHHLRLLRPHFLASRWFQDLRQGRKCGDGDEIFRQSATIHGRLCFVVVYENWGDLVVQVYRSNTAECYRVLMGIHSVFQLLSSKPLMLHLWICSVKSNQYPTTIVSVILSSLKFTPDERDLIMGNLAEVRPKSKPVCITTIIQNRRVILKFRDTIGGDLHVTLFDTSESQTYRLHLELESIRCALKKVFLVEAKARRRNLLLTRNRYELCKWITTRLRFQRLLEHPEVLASSCSPLTSGTQVRVSLSMFNEWVVKSSRSPLSTVSKRDIDLFAARSDALLFHGLAHEQLAFVSEPRLAYSNEKAWIDTQDFVNNASGASTDVKVLKIDFYFKAHYIYARVRQQIQEEVTKRRESEEAQRLENEEVLSEAREIEDLCISSQHEMSRLFEALKALHTATRNRYTITDQIFDELLRRTRQPQYSRLQGPKRNKRKTNHVRPLDLVRAKSIVSRIMSTLRVGDDLAFELLLRQSLGVTGTLSMLDQHVTQIIAYLDEDVCPALQNFISKARVGFDPKPTLSTLRNTRSEFYDLLDSFRKVNSAEADPIDRITKSTASDESVSGTSRTGQNSDSNEVISFILPPTGAIEEICLNFNFKHLQSFSTCATTLVEKVASLFSSLQTWSSSSSGWSTKRIPKGIIVFNREVAVSARSVEWNPRASALAHEQVSGIAVFILNTSQFLMLTQANSLYQQLTSPTTVALSSQVESPYGSTKGAKRHTAQRSKQLLAWKQFSVERMHAARKVTQQRRHRVLLLESLEADSARERMTLATCSVDRFHAEWIFGNHASERFGSFAMSTLSQCLLLKHTRRDQWTLLLRDEHQTQLFFNDEQQAMPVLSEATHDVIQLQHVRVNVDDWQRPKRLIFSCRELQSRRGYFLDSSYLQLLKLIDAGSTEQKVSISRTQLASTEWRRLALESIKMLRLTPKQGSLSLSFVNEAVEQGIEMTEGLKLGNGLNDSICLSTEVACPTSSLPAARLLLTHREYQLRQATHFCSSRRWLKQQSQLRYSAVSRQLNEIKDNVNVRRLPLEWLRMTQEDWRSQELKGYFALKEKDLGKLKQAFRRFHQQSGSSSNLISNVGAMFMQIDRAMGAKENDKESDLATRYEEEAAQFLSSMEGMKWWCQKHRRDELRLDFADITQWWQWRRSK